MRLSRILFLLLVLLLIAAFVLFYRGPFGPASPYHRFHNRGADYYSELARAADVLIVQHTNFIKVSDTTNAPSQWSPKWINANEVAVYQIKLPTTDPALPRLIRDLNPEEILLAPNRVYMGFGVSRAHWAIIWERDEIQTNTWVLSTNGDGYVRKAYTENR